MPTLTDDIVIENITFHSQKSKYVEAINSFLDAIPFNTPSDFKIIIEELTRMKQSKFDAQNLIPCLDELQDLYNEASYAYTHHADQFRLLVIERIDGFMSVYSTEDQQLILIKSQADLEAERVAKREAEKKLVAAAKAVLEGSNGSTGRMDKTISEQLKTRMIEIGLCLETRKEEAEICVKVFDIKQEANELMKNKDPLRLKTLRFKFLDIMKRSFNIDNEYELDFEGLYNFTVVLDNVFNIFNASKITVNEFCAYSFEERNFLLSDPRDLLRVVDSTNKQEFGIMLCYKQLLAAMTEVAESDEQVESARISTIIALKDNFDIVFDIKATSASQIIKIENSVIKIFSYNVFTLALFNSFDEDTQKKLLDDPYEICELVSKFSLPAEIVGQRDFSFVTRLVKNMSSIRKLLPGSGVTMLDLLRLPENTMFNLLEKPEALLLLIAKSEIKLKDLFELTIDDLVFILADANHIARLKTIANYYFLPVDKILLRQPRQAGNTQSRTLNKALLLYPEASVKLFVEPNATYAQADLQECLDTAVARFKDHTDRLINAGYLINLTKIAQAPLWMVVSQLQEIGMPFSKCRVIYEAMLHINVVFTRNLINKWTATNENSILELDSSYSDIACMFSEEESVMVNNMLTAQINALTACLESNVSKFDSAFPDLDGFIQTLSDEGNDNEAVHVYMHELRKKIDGIFEPINKENVGIKHIRLYQHLLSSKIGENYLIEDCVWMKTVSKWKTYLENNTSPSNFRSAMQAAGEVALCNEAFDFYKFYENMFSFKQNMKVYKRNPAYHVDIIDGTYENELFKAIFDGNLTETKRLIGNGNMPIGYNSKGLSYYACALDCDNASLHKVIKDKVISVTENVLRSFLLTGKVKTINGMSVNGDTALTIAIKQERTDIIQSLLARDIDVTRPMSDGITPVQLALSLGQHGIANDLMMVAYKQKASQNNTARLTGI